MLRSGDDFGRQIVDICCKYKKIQIKKYLKRKRALILEKLLTASLSFYPKKRNITQKGNIGEKIIPLGRRNGITHIWIAGIKYIITWMYGRAD